MLLPRIGFLHLEHDAPAEVGMSCYGRLLAQALRDLGGFEVAESTHRVSDSTEELKEALCALLSSDVCHLQFSIARWDRLLRDGRALRLLSEFPRPVVLTLHDTLEPLQGRGYLKLFAPSRPFGPLVRYMGRTFLKTAAELVVHSRGEVQTIARHIGRQPVRIPHLAEAGVKLLPRQEAKKKLGLEGRRVVTLPGFVSVRKGCELFLEAALWLSDDISAVVAGGPAAGSERFFDELTERMRSLAAAGRVKFTGHLGEAELQVVQAATDLAVFPYRGICVTKSLYPWISNATPVLAYALPEVEEYNRLVPGAIGILEMLTSESLRRAIEEGLKEEAVARQRSKLAELADLLGVNQTARRYAEVYRQVVSSARHVDYLEYRFKYLR